MNLKETTQYQEAVSETSKGWSDGGIGFTEKESLSTISTLSRQLNTILFTVLQLRLEVASLREEVRRGKAPAKDLTELSEQLKKFHINEKGASYKRAKGTIKVFKNPFDLLKEIK